MLNNNKVSFSKMSTKAFSKVLLVTISMLLAMCFVLAASAQTQALVYPEPSALTLVPEDESPIHIRIDNAEGLYGFEVHLEFDPTLIQVIDSDQDTPDVQVDHGDVFKVDKSFVVSNQVDNEQGTVVYAITQLAPSEPVNGNGVLLSLNIQATALGESELTLSSVVLASEAGEALSVESQNGHIIVAQEIGETATSIPLTNTPVTTMTSTPPSAATATPATETQATATLENTPTTEVNGLVATTTLLATVTKQDTPAKEKNEVTQTSATVLQTATNSVSQDVGSQPATTTKDDNSVSGGLIGLSIAGLGLVLFFVIKRYSQKS